jgi:hypothetical protein
LFLIAFILPDEVREGWIGRNKGYFISHGTFRGRVNDPQKLAILAGFGVSPLELLPPAPSL